MKDSEVEAIGVVPKAWTVCRLKFYIDEIEQGWSPQCENRMPAPGEWGVLKVGCMNSGIYDESECKALPTDLDARPEYEVEVGDVLMSRSNTVGLVGMSGMVHATQGGILLCDKLYRIRVRQDVLDPEYAAIILRAPYSRTQVEPEATGASPSMRNISADVVRNLLLPFPPIEEQRELLKYIKEKWSEIDLCQRRIQRGVELLKEYRTALISAAVTGQIDVRDEVHLDG